MESVEEQQNLVDTFLGITSASKEEAIFFLESHNWQIDSAVHSFFENHAASSPAPSSPPPQSLSPPLPSSLSPPQIPVAATKMASSSSARDKKTAKPSGGIRTLSDLNRRSAADSDSDSDGPPEYYTGGEKSGMLVCDPTKGGGNNDVDAIFDKARQLGAREGPVDRVQAPPNSRSFTGTGRLLSGETVLTPASQQPESIVHDIIFWSNGFTVDDGPLRRLDDPENAPFLESIRKSECPKELEPADKRVAVHVNLIRREENCPEQEKQYVPFQGVGRTLGGGSTSSPAPTGETAAAVPTSAPTPSVGLVVDDSKPSTSIQLRLGDGTRMVARFNYHHTVGDIRAFIDASRPGCYRGYQLQTVGFPPKKLTDVTQTIEQAGLANSVVIQKL